VIAAYYALIGLGLIAYALTGGADFGAGVWDLLSRGQRQGEQRAAINRIIAPIWEANHVWLIFVIVLVFTVFPRAFAQIGLRLHVPLTIALIGIVLRGAAFTFRAYGLGPERQRLWGRIFAVSSLITPLALGMALGGLATGAELGYFSGWTTSFAIAVGLLASVLFALLAAVYLAADTQGVVAEDFRRSAILTEVVAAPIAAFALWRAYAEVPTFFTQLLAWPFGVVVQLSAFFGAIATILLLARRRYALARVAVILQVSAVVLGFGAGMRGDFILGVVSIHDAGTRPEMLSALSVSVAAGACLLIPALVLLFRIRQR
jgi:cytochrome d ubiquinol oxidase subunit II